MTPGCWILVMAETQKTVLVLLQIASYHDLSQCCSAQLVRTFLHDPHDGGSLQGEIVVWVAELLVWMTLGPW